MKRRITVIVDIEDMVNNTMIAWKVKKAITDIFFIANVEKVEVEDDNSAERV